MSTRTLTNSGKPAYLRVPLDKCQYYRSKEGSCVETWSPVRDHDLGHIVDMRLLTWVYVVWLGGSH